jgi:hypothetical protein
MSVGGINNGKNDKARDGSTGVTNMVGYSGAGRDSSVPKPDPVPYEQEIINSIVCLSF